MKALIIIPTFNELDNIDMIIERVSASIPDDILIVDDASPDGTGARADQLALENPRLSVLHRRSREGLGPAYRAGFDWAFARGYDLIVEIDADGSHPAETLPALLTIARSTHADLVIGSRWVNGGHVQGWSLTRQWISQIGNTYARWVLGSSIRDLTAGFRVLRSDSLKHLDLSTIASSGYCFQVEVAYRIESAGGTVIEHPITFVERALGVSKMHTGIVLEALTRITGWGFARLFRRT